MFTNARLFTKKSLLTPGLTVLSRSNRFFIVNLKIETPCPCARPGNLLTSQFQWNFPINVKVEYALALFEYYVNLCVCIQSTKCTNYIPLFNFVRTLMVHHFIIVLMHRCAIYFLISALKCTQFNSREGITEEQRDRVE